MIRTFLVSGASALALALSAPAVAQDAAAAAEAATPTLDFGTWGFDPQGLNAQVDPGDDFFAYVNSKWIAENELPGDKARFGGFDVVNEETRNNVRTMIEELRASNPAPGTQERRVVDAYNAYFDQAAIDAAGLAPAQPYLDTIGSADSLNDLVALFAQPGYPALVSAGVTVDEKDPNSYIASVGFDGMGLPDRDYYLVDSERNQTIRDKYRDYLTYLLGQAGYDQPQEMAARVYDFERQVAQLEWDRVPLRNSDLTYNKVARDELYAMAGDFPVDTLLRTIDLQDTPAFSIAQIPPTAEEVAELELTEEYLSGIGGGLPAMMQLLTQTPLDVLKAYMSAQFLSNHASVLPSAIDDANFAFYGTTLSGTEEQQPRWKRAIGNTQGMIGEVVGKAYVERYFPPESKAAMDELVANLLKAMRVSIMENEFMGDETRAQALAKLETFNPKIGYPDEFETYEGLELTSDDPLANRIASMRWGQQDNLSKLGQPVDRSEWFMLPTTVNAYYNPVFNEIVFPAAILQQPFFGPDADPAVNYGAIGGVIGHEIGHGFDDQGAKYAADGSLNDWWEEGDLARFNTLADKLAAQYDAYCPYDEGETCVNGRFTLGENIGDVGGLSLAYRAYRLSLDGKEAPVIDGLTGDQRFFLAWAQVWRSMQREANGRQRLQTDPHSPEEYRVNGAVRNQDAWYKAFNVTPGDELYLSPEERIRIW